MLYQQPQSGPFRLDPAHPLVKDFALVWVASAPDIDLVTGKVATWEGTLPLKVPVGNQISRKFIGTGALSFGTRPDLNFSGLSNQTIFAEVFIPNTASVSGFILGRVQSAWDYSLSVDSGAQQFSFGTGGTSGGGSVTAPPSSVANGLLPYQGRPLAVCGTYDKVNAKLTLAELPTNSVAQTTSFANSSDIFAIGGRGGGNQPSLNGVFASLVIISKKTWTDAETASMRANPWQIFIDEDEEGESIFYVPTAGAGAYTIPAAQGSYAITGNAATLRAARKLAAGTGSYALTGNQAVPRAARRLGAAVGTYSITGSPANLIKGVAPRMLTAASGSYVITGRPAALRAARQLKASPGAYALTGYATIAPAVAVRTGTIQFRHFHTRPMRVVRLA